MIRKRVAMGFVNPKTLTDAELLEDLEAAKSMSADIMASDEVLDIHKQEFAQHVKDLIQEYEERKQETWIYPLSALGIVDF